MFATRFSSRSVRPQPLFSQTKQLGFYNSKIIRQSQCLILPTKQLPVYGGNFSKTLYTSSKANVRRNFPRNSTTTMAPVVKTPHVVNSSRLYQTREAFTRSETIGVMQSGWGATAALSTAGIGAICYYGISSKADKEAWPLHVRQRIRATYGYVAGGLAATATLSFFMFHSGIAFRVMAANPFVVLLGGLVSGIGSIMAMHAISPENVIPRHIAFGIFNAGIALSLSPLGILGGPLLMKALTITGAVVGSLTMVAASSPSDTFLWMGGPLSIGLGGLIGASLCQMFFPASIFLHNIVMYGGLGLFSFFMLYDTQRVIAVANHAPEGQYDPMTASLGIYLNIIQIFWRIAIMLSGSSNSRRK